MADRRTDRVTAEPYPRRVVTRRNFLYLSGLAAAGVVATACGGGDACRGRHRPPLAGSAGDGWGGAPGHDRRGAGPHRRHPADPGGGAEHHAGRQSDAGSGPAILQGRAATGPTGEGRQAAAGGRAPAEDPAGRPADRAGRQVRRHLASDDAQPGGPGLAQPHGRARAAGALGYRVGAGDSRRRRVLPDQPRRAGVHVQAARGAALVGRRARQRRRHHVLVGGRHAGQGTHPGGRRSS